MDEPDVDRASLVTTLRDLRRLNGVMRWRETVVQRVAAAVHEDGLRRFRLLDVATGSADIPEAVQLWAAQQGLQAEIVATDFHPLTIRAAASMTGDRGIHFMRHDALASPFAVDAFDIATLNLALHHFPPQAAVAVLQEMGRVARWIIVTDLVRCYPAYLGALALAQVLRGRLSAVDGPLSVRRAYTVSEVGRMAAAAGLRARVDRAFPFHLVLQGTRAGKRHGGPL
jgi:SAM-dependent methyltransferase